MVFSAFVCGLLSVGVDPNDTKMLSQPAVSQRHIAFIYADDLWIADGEGRNPRRLTVHPGVEANPVFSPDGKSVAFSGQYDGNTDVYLVPVEGGNADSAHAPSRGRHRSRLHARRQAGAVRVAAQRLHAEVSALLHSAAFGRHADAASDPQRQQGRVIRRTARRSPTRRLAKPWSNGRTIAAAPIRESGSTTPRAMTIQEIPQPKSRCNDTDPQWVDAETVSSAPIATASSTSSRSSPPISASCN